MTHKRYVYVLFDLHSIIGVSATKERLLQLADNYIKFGTESLHVQRYKDTGELVPYVTIPFDDFKKNKRTRVSDGQRKKVCVD